LYNILIRKYLSLNSAITVTVLLSISQLAIPHSSFLIKVFGPHKTDRQTRKAEQTHANKEKFKKILKQYINKLILHSYFKLKVVKNYVNCVAGSTEEIVYVGLDNFQMCICIIRINSCCLCIETGE